MPTEKKPKTSFAACEGSPITPRLVIDLTYSKGTKDGVTRSEPVMTTMLKIASSIVDRIAQHRGSIVPPLLKPVLRRPLGAKSGSSLERLANMKSNKVDSAAKVTPRPTPHAAETDSPAGNEETTRVGTCKKSTKPAFGEAAEICALLKPDMLDDMDPYVPSLSMGLKGLFAQVPLRNIRPSIG
ncbi:hypothetical protein ACFX1Q_037531 [Malus domestica]